MISNIQVDVPSKTEKATMKCVECAASESIPTSGYGHYKCTSCACSYYFHIADVGCTCGSDTFQVTVDRILCPNCGSDSLWS